MAMSNNTVSSDELEKIRKRVRSMMSEKRYLHTLGVEREIIRLSEIFLPEKREKLRAAALLHDITKEYSPEKQVELCEKYSIEVSDSMKRSPKLYHAVTGAYLAKTLFPEAVDNEVFDAITYHTTGRCAMTMADKLLYLADYIEDTRTFDDCVKLRKYFYDGIENASSYEEKYTHLQKTLLLSFDMTIKNLLDEGAPVDPETLRAKKYIEEELNKNA